MSEILNSLIIVIENVIQLRYDFFFINYLESNKMKTSVWADVLGASLSTLCIIHCLFLPVLGMVLPIFGLISGTEWIHKVLVLMTIPVSGILIIKPKRIFVAPLAGLGLLLLFLAAFWKFLHDSEVLITVTGALLLFSAHMLRFQSMKHLA